MYTVAAKAVGVQYQTVADGNRTGVASIRKVCLHVRGVQVKRKHVQERNTITLLTAHVISTTVASLITASAKGERQRPISSPGQSLSNLRSPQSAPHTYLNVESPDLRSILHSVITHLKTRCAGVSPWFTIHGGVWSFASALNSL